MTMILQDQRWIVHFRSGWLPVVASLLLGPPCAAAAADKPVPAARADGWKSKLPATDSGKPAVGSKSAPADGTSDVAATTLPNLSGHPTVAAEKAAADSVTAKTSIADILSRTLPSRTDRPADWQAGLEPLHRCGEPRWIEPCIPPPPCHPALPPHPYDLVGVAGDPTCGPIYRGPCCPRTDTHDDGPWPRMHRVHDRLFDHFYRPK